MKKNEELSDGKRDVLGRIFSLQNVNEYAQNLMGDENGAIDLIQSTFDSLCYVEEEKLWEIYREGNVEKFIEVCLYQVARSGRSSFRAPTKKELSTYHIEDLYETYTMEGDGVESEEEFLARMGADDHFVDDDLVDYGSISHLIENKTVYGIVKKALDRNSKKDVDFLYKRKLWEQKIIKEKTYKQINVELGISIRAVHYSVAKVNEMLKKEIVNYMVVYDVSIEDLLNE